MTEMRSVAQNTRPSDDLEMAWDLWCACGYGGVADSPEAAVLALAAHLENAIDSQITKAHNRLMNIPQIEVGSHVEGSYMGTAFRGAVTSRRMHTINHLVCLTCVDLDAPVEIKTIGRTEDKWLMVATAWDGTTCPPEAGDWYGDWIKVVT